jgi:hypothetical protein
MRRAKEEVQANKQKSLILRGNQALPLADSIFPPLEEFSWSKVLGRFSDSWIVLLATPSRPVATVQWLY